MIIIIIIIIIIIVVVIIIIVILFAQIQHKLSNMPHKMMEDNCVSCHSQNFYIEFKVMTMASLKTPKTIPSCSEPPIAGQFKLIRIGIDRFVIIANRKMTIHQCL